MNARVALALQTLRQSARQCPGVTDPDAREAMRLAYYDAEQIVRGAFDLELEFGTDVGWPPPLRSTWSCHGCGRQWPDGTDPPCDCDPLESVLCSPPCIVKVDP